MYCMSFVNVLDYLMKTLLRKNCGVSFAVCSEDLRSSTWKSKRKWGKNEKVELVLGKKESHAQMKGGVPSRSCIAGETQRLLILSNTLRAMSLAADPFCDLAIEASILPPRHRAVTPDRAELEHQHRRGPSSSRACGQLEEGGTRGAAGGPWTAMSVRQEERRRGDGGDQRGFATIRENIIRVSVLRATDPLMTQIEWSSSRPRARLVRQSLHLSFRLYL